MEKFQNLLNVGPFHRAWQKIKINKRRPTFIPEYRVHGPFEFWWRFQAFKAVWINIYVNFVAFHPKWIDEGTLKIRIYLRRFHFQKIQSFKSLSKMWDFIVVRKKVIIGIYRVFYTPALIIYVLKTNNVICYSQAGIVSGDGRHLTILGSGQDQVRNLGR